MSTNGLISVLNAVLEDTFGSVFQLISQILSFIGQVLYLFI